MSIVYLNCICQTCSKRFHLKQSSVKQGMGKYCSRPCNTIARKGKPAWNKGRDMSDYPHTGFQKGHIPFLLHHSEETKRKLSELKKGVPLSDYHKSRLNTSGLRKEHAWNKGKPNTWSKFPVMKGKENPSWKGGITPINTKLRNSLEYEEWRKAVFERDNYTCQLCFSIGNYLHADHIKSFSEFPELRFSIDNGRTLCVDCHFEVTFKKKIVHDSKWGHRK